MIVLDSPGRNYTLKQSELINDPATQWLDKDLLNKKTRRGIRYEKESCATAFLATCAAAFPPLKPSSRMRKKVG
jgi:hypothetical protein